MSLQPFRTVRTARHAKSVGKSQATGFDTAKLTAPTAFALRSAASLGRSGPAPPSEPVDNVVTKEKALVRAEHMFVLQSLMVPVTRITPLAQGRGPVLQELAARFARRDIHPSSITLSIGGFVLPEIPVNSVSSVHGVKIPKWTLGPDLLLHGGLGSDIAALTTVLREQDGMAGKKTSPRVGHERTTRLTFQQTASDTALIVIRCGNPIIGLFPLKLREGRLYGAALVFDRHGGSSFAKRLLIDGLTADGKSTGIGLGAMRFIIKGGQLVITPTEFGAPSSTITILSHQRRYEGGGVAFHRIGGREFVRTSRRVRAVHKPLAGRYETILSFTPSPHSTFISSDKPLPSMAADKNSPTTSKPAKQAKDVKRAGLACRSPTAKQAVRAERANKSVAEMNHVKAAKAGGGCVLA